MALEPIGQQFGDYLLVRTLRRGGQASVYLGQHVRLQQRLAAVKLLQAQLSSEDIASFQREADTIAELQHPQIVSILDFNVKDGTPFLVMDYYAAGTLRERHRRGEQVPLSTVITYVHQVAEALQYAHDHRVIHRDVKAANMLIGHRDEIVLSDFGIAAAAHSTTSMRIQSFAGTVPYMAPEQIKRFPRRESDQYALAIVTYEWLTGELPFNGTPEEIAVKHLAADPPPMNEKVPTLSPRVEQVIFKALAKDPKLRFARVKDFALALEDAQQNTHQHFSSFWSSPISTEEATSSNTDEALEKNNNSPTEPVRFASAPTEAAVLAEVDHIDPIEAEQAQQPNNKEPGEPAQDPSAQAREPERPSESSRQELDTPTEPVALANATSAVLEPSPSSRTTSAVGLEALPPPALPLAEFYATTDREAAFLYPNQTSMGGTAYFRLTSRPQPISGREVMKRIGRENTPSTWRILLPSRGKIILSNLWSALEYGVFGILIVYLLLPCIYALFPPPVHPALNATLSPQQMSAMLQQWNQDNTTYVYIVFLGAPGLVALLMGTCAALWNHRAKASNLLVLLPEGLVYGKRSQPKKLEVINFWEVIELRTNYRRQMVVRLTRKGGGTCKKRLDLSLFIAPKALALSIKSAMDDYKRSRGIA